MVMRIKQAPRPLAPWPPWPRMPRIICKWRLNAFYGILEVTESVLVTRKRVVTKQYALDKQTRDKKSFRHLPASFCCSFVTVYFVSIELLQNEFLPAVSPSVAYMKTIKSYLHLFGGCLPVVSSLTIQAFSPIHR